MMSPIIIIDGVSIVKNKIIGWRRVRHSPTCRPFLFVGVIGSSPFEFVVGGRDQTDEEAEKKYRELEDRLIEAVREGDTE